MVKHIDDRNKNRSNFMFRPRRIHAMSPAANNKTLLMIT